MADQQPSVIDHFDQRSAFWDELYSRPIFKDRLNLFTGQLQKKVKAPANILDYGCGSGVISLLLASKGYNVTGIDASTGMIAEATKNAEAQKADNASFYQLDNITPDSLTNRFDAIVCSSVIEYIEDDEAVLKLFSQWIKPGGTLLVSVPHSASLLGKLEDLLSKKHRDVHFCQKRYQEETFKNQLTQLGFGNFHSTYFEVPKLGEFGVALSRSKHLGLMLLLEAQKPV